MHRNLNQILFIIMKFSLEHLPNMSVMFAEISKTGKETAVEAPIPKA